ncbi:MAG: mechanosensitive ion channel family protein [Pseudomonadota bacterium]
MAHLSNRPDWLAKLTALLLTAGLLFGIPSASIARDGVLDLGQSAPATTPGSGPAAAPDKNAEPLPVSVDVAPQAQDGAIAERIARIMRATGWFEDVSVAVRDGVVFLGGTATSDDRKEWAGNLARKTQDTVAAVNRLDVVARPVWDFAPAADELGKLWRSLVEALPAIALAILILPLAWLAFGLIFRLADRRLQSRITSTLLRRLAARALAVPVLLFAAYLVLQMAGLTRLALTIIGGTGVLGIVIGFAFRDIAENFLASVLLSVRQPFRADDFIEVAGHRGLVQQLNSRSTVLMTVDGNHVQIPNATIFKSTIVNLTANPNARGQLVIGIGYDHSIADAQNVVATVLRAHPAVLDTPAPLVLVDELGSSAIRLRGFFWYDFTRYNEFKLRSALLRQAVRKLEEAGITAPDDAREIIFPDGVPLIEARRSRLAKNAQSTDAGSDDAAPEAQPQSDPVRREGPRCASLERDTAQMTNDEGGLASDTHDLQSQADRARSPEPGRNLLEGG